MTTFINPFCEKCQTMGKIRKTPKMNTLLYKTIVIICKKIFRESTKKS